MTTAAPTAPMAPVVVTTMPAAAASPPDESRTYRDGPGDLRIDPRVIRTLVAHAAQEVDGVTRASVGPIARAIHHPAPPSAPAEQLAIDLSLSISVEYPRPLRTVAETLAAHVAERVEDLLGRKVGDLSVRVDHLQPARERVH